MSTPLDFPLNPVIDDIHTGSNSVNYQWDGDKWTTQLVSRNSSLGGNPGTTPPNNAFVGDFWFKTPENELYIALSDATGTGVDWVKTSLRDPAVANPLP